LVAGNIFVFLSFHHGGFVDLFHGVATAPQFHLALIAITAFGDMNFKFAFLTSIRTADLGSIHGLFPISGGRINGWHFQGIGSAKEQTVFRR